MGILDRIGGAISRESEADELGQEFAGEIEEEGAVETEPEPEEEPEWDSAYKFGEDMVQADDFANMMDFINKAMFYQIDRSPLYRDRIQQGSQTIDMVSKSINKLDESLGGGSSAMNYGQLAEEIEGANKLIDALDSLKGEDEIVIGELIGLGHDVVDVMKEGNVGGGEVETESREVDREL